jgi:uncharacterized protein YjbI with pentapeptide repeats
MDRDKALKLLKGGTEGVAEWNRRRKAGESIPNLYKFKLIGADLSGANLAEADLRGAELGSSYLSRASFQETNLGNANLRDAQLIEAFLRQANLNKADLCGANLSGAYLSGADFSRANLSGANLKECACGGGVFAHLDLSEVLGLDSGRHLSPSTIGTDTLLLSKGKIPEAFLRGCGLSPWEVLSQRLYSPELTPAGLSELQYQIFDAWTKGRSMLNGCFISYSWKDTKMVENLRNRLLAEGINVWLDRHDMNAGVIQDQVWRAIQVHHVVIIVLSKDSGESDWVENELEMARNKEKEQERPVLCPIALDDTWKEKLAAKDRPGDPSRQLWRTLQQKLIVDFSGWETKRFDEPFQKLVRGLKTNYGPKSSTSSLGDAAMSD